MLTLLDAFLLGARRMELIGQRMLDGLRAAEIYAEACRTTEMSQRVALLTEVEKLIDGTRTGTGGAGTRVPADLAQRKQALRARLDNEALCGQRSAVCVNCSVAWPMPVRWPSEVKHCPCPNRSAWCCPHRWRETRALNESKPLRCERMCRGWSLTATHRIGLMIDAGNVDRYQLPD